MNIYCLLLLSVSFNVYAINWQDLWTTKDQQAQRLMQKKEFKNAQRMFQQPSWRAAAAYRAGEYSRAATDYSALNTAEGYYNQGNALAKLGQYETAMKAYDKALKMNPRHEDAIYNRKIIERLLQKKNEQQKSENESDNKSDKQEKKNSAQQDKSPLEKKSNDENLNSDPSPNKEQGQGQTDNQKQDNKRDKEAEKEVKVPQNAQPNEGRIKEKGKNENSLSKTSEEAHEKQLAKEQLLRLIPDDPAGLLREKFLRDHLRRQQGNFR